MLTNYYRLILVGLITEITWKGSEQKRSFHCCRIDLFSRFHYSSAFRAKEEDYHHFLNL